MPIASCAANGIEDRKVAAREQPDTKGDKNNPDHHRDIWDVTLHRRGQRDGEQPEAAEHRQEAQGHRRGGRQRPAHRGQRAGALAAHDQGQVGRQQREATRVERGYQSAGESQSHQPLLHVDRST